MNNERFKKKWRSSKQPNRVFWYSPWIQLHLGSDISSGLHITHYLECKFNFYFWEHTLNVLLKGQWIYCILSWSASAVIWSVIQDKSKFLSWPHSWVFRYSITLAEHEQVLTPMLHFLAFVWWYQPIMKT